jgi:hypothetical protein
MDGKARSSTALHSAQDHNEMPAGSIHYFKNLACLGLHPFKGSHFPPDSNRSELKIF